MEANSISHRVIKCADDGGITHLELSVDEWQQLQATNFFNEETL